MGSFSSKYSTLFERKGLPIGNLTSQLFANIYLNEFDQFVKHNLKVKNYIRYSDDFVIIAKERFYLENIIISIRSFLKERLALELHPKKVSIHKFHQGIDFLGYILLSHHLLFALTWLFSRRYRTSKEEFLVAGRRLGRWESAFSVAATWIWAPALFVAAQKA